MIGVSSRLTEPRISELLAAAGIDIDRLTAISPTVPRTIDAVLKRNNEQAEAFGFSGTPSFIVGKYPRAGRALHDRVRAGHRRRPQGQDELARPLDQRNKSVPVADADGCLDS